MPARYDVVVVGAGIMGVASAYHLQNENPGKKILVVDRYGGAGQGNTGRSNAMFRNTFSSSDNQVLADSSIDFYLHVQKELKVDIGLQEIGYLWLMNEAQLSKSEPFLRRMEGNGIATAPYGKEDLKRLIPGMATGFADDETKVMGLPPVDGGVFGPKCGRLDPDRLVRFYAGEFARAGGEFAFGSEVKRLMVGPSEPLGIEGEPLVWQETRVEGVSLAGSSQTDVLADMVVLAGGAWLNELLEPIGVDGHVKAKKRQLFSVRAEGSKLERLLHTPGFNRLGLLPLVILPKAGVHFKPVSEEGCFWVACEDEMNRPYIDLPEHDLDRYGAESQYYERGIYPVLTSYFPAFRGSKLKAMWAGLYAYNTLDNLPFAFRTGNLIVVGGDSGSGIMKGDALGRAVGALYSEEDEAVLYGGRAYRTSKLGFERRDVEREEWVI
ncbi:MAG: FAD-binding oxidoreductase [Nitrososphaerota archaeon]|nr:FAD-binding oxidoreductase [Nitrososphaerota archaeon]